MSEIRNDLTSLPNWSQWFNDTTKATVGQHTLKVKAKGSGYRDSKLSTAVTFNIYHVSTVLAGCTASYSNRILQYTDLGIVFTAKEGFTFSNTTISTTQIEIGSTAYTPTSADTYVVSEDGTTATLTINAEAVTGNIIVTVALTEKLATPTEFTVTKGLASWNTVDKATAYEIVAVSSNDIESSIGSYTPSTTTLINFTIAGTSYQAEEGMTWEQWCNSSYNAGGFICSGANQTVNFPNLEGNVWINSTNVIGADMIVANGAYYEQSGGSAN
mgnify:CR=1 FL=1